MRTNENCLKSSGRNWTKERSDEHHSNARRGRNQAHGEEAPRVFPGRHGDRQRRRRRGRAQARPGLRGRGDCQEEPRHQFLVYRAKGVLGRGRGTHFQTYSPTIDSIELKRKGDVRRAKLYYMRKLSGKGARIREKIEGHEPGGEPGGEQ